MSNQAPNSDEVPPKSSEVEETATSETPAADEQTAIDERDTIDSTKDDDDTRKMFIGGLSWETTIAELQEYFEKFGSIKEVTIKTDFMGRSRGFGFVLFEEEKAVTSVLDEKTHSLKNKKIDPKRAEARGGKEPIRKVFVGGVAVDIPEEDIRQHFEQYGPVAEIEFPFNKLKNERKGFCFVTFVDAESCDKAAAEAKQSLGAKKCDVKKAIPKEDPRAWSGEPGYFRGGMRGGRGGRSGRGGYGGGVGGGGFYGAYYGGGDYYEPYANPNGGGANGYPGFNNYYYGYYGPQYGYSFPVTAQNYGYNQQHQQQQQQQPVAK